jgi:hypothetical protein
LFDNNYASGVECISASVQLKQCVIMRNLAGIGVNGETSRFMIRESNIFTHRLNGIEIMDSEQEGGIEDCHIAGLKDVCLCVDNLTLNIHKIVCMEF